ncbi:unnamed protein product [Victoria cruziana]
MINNRARGLIGTSCYCSRFAYNYVDLSQSPTMVQGEVVLVRFQLGTFFGSLMEPLDGLPYSNFAWEAHG